jgi:4-hydroxy-tetrahydrodipicolinate synthase
MLSGIIPPVVTPFDENDEIDENGLRAVVRFMLEAGVHGLAVCGSTGEGHTLSPDETRRITEITAEEVNSHIAHISLHASRFTHHEFPIIVGIIANSTCQALQNARAVRDLPVAALMVTPPHYLFTPSETEMFAYFRSITEETGLPVLVYNVVPWAYLSADALVRLMVETPNVIGVKQSAGNLHALAWLLANLPEGKVVLTAVDDLLYPSFPFGRSWCYRWHLHSSAKIERPTLGCCQSRQPRKGSGMSSQVAAVMAISSRSQFPCQSQSGVDIARRSCGVAQEDRCNP